MIRREARRARPGPLRFGYFSGTTTHDEDWHFVEPAVVACLDAHPEVELWLGGHLPDSPALVPFGARVRRLPFVHWTELPALLRDVDVNLAPLAPGSRFNEAKSAIKWLEAALCATVTVATPTGPFREAIEADGAGILASGIPEWERALDDARDQRGRASSSWRTGSSSGPARVVTVASGRSLPRDPRGDPVMPARRTSACSSWEDAVTDEPWMATALEPYADETRSKRRGDLPLRVSHDRGAAGVDPT